MLELRRRGMQPATFLRMFKKLLITLGLAKAPAPVRSYFVASSMFGTIPALAFVAWKNRDRIRGLLQRGNAHQAELAVTG